MKGNVFAMIRSMTGYGRDQQLLHGRSITVEIRSVNHRYFEFSFFRGYRHFYLFFSDGYICSTRWK